MELALNRLMLAFQAFWRTLTQADFAIRVKGLMSTEPEGPDIRALAVLQRDGRLIDFLMEDIDSYGDAQIGAAVRDIHHGCRKSLRDYVTLEPILDGQEDSAVNIQSGFDPAAIRLIGNVAGAPPFNGRLKHHGWRVKAVKFPSLPGSSNALAILAPAEVEIQ